MSWRVYASSVIGSSHRQNNLPCQDAFCYRNLGDRLVAVVCDGAGSAAYGEQGAALVSRELVEGLVKFTAVPDENQLSTLVESVRKTILSQAQERERSAGDFACTVVAAWLGESASVMLHIGDGVAALHIDADEHFSLPENGEYANQTWFLTSHDWRDHLRISQFAGRATQLVMMSDGVQPFALNRRGDALFSPFMDPVLRYLQQVSEAKGSEAICATLDDPRSWAITGDDKTLLVALRHEA
ncbi:PP2C family serine/threonine-protein phosphatase [Klebsiella pasteurii]|uniref:PP2C family serine/threonine-protein phosphatase n=1 Tax=Klebsiella TaxID=570 RepID=UPI000DD39194|nr:MULTISPECIES: PP2C family serine/threonine-protein phosphatase [Klebsiella]MDD9662099.1 PP2C family serine/threonine-protein phosphatase [Klebsiella pasteurii]MDD9668188.1 PP2C family serine/threonine-protein phosphatase [Klebsiella pasteurii]MDD9683773.1 PP2C family serine/threonine-protein phosphatase [Klebsiella pasteurii]MDH0312158.1 protein phosphatase 2C domain-containing protein [Klebsiella pasteurii]MDM4218734.1 PP2C family serine/threonine-protein phosphatase [Klebsiella pasteurii]